MAFHPRRQVDPGVAPQADTRTKAITVGALVAIMALTAVSGCSAGTSATDAVVPAASTAERAGSTGSSLSQTLGTDRMVQGVVDVLSTSTELAWAKYQEMKDVDNPQADAEAMEAFVTTATARGVPAAVANDMAAGLASAARDIEVQLIMEWNTAVEPLPSSPPKNIKTELTPRMRDAEQAVAAAMGDLATSGLPADWPGALNEAQARAEGRLPSGVTREDLAVALSPLAQWRPAPTKQVKKPAKSR